MSEWISVEDRLPDKFCKVLVVWKANGETVIDTAFWTDQGFAVSHWCFMQVRITHWMPLPEAPKEG